MRNRLTTVISIIGIFVVSLFFISSDIMDFSSIENGHVVYSHEKVFDSSGSIVDESIYGSPYYVDDQNNIHFYKDVGILPDGSRFVEEHISYSVDDSTSITKTIIAKVKPESVNSTNQDYVIEQENKFDDTLPITTDLLGYLNSRSPDDVEKFIIQLKQQPVLTLPKVPWSLFSELPELVMEAQISRIEAIEQRKQLFSTFQEDLVRNIKSVGGEIEKQFWIINAISVEMKIGDLLNLAKQPDIFLIELNKQLIPASDIYATHLRKVTQAEYFRRTRLIDQNQVSFEGDRATDSYPGASSILVAVIDKNIQVLYDLNHPAFEDDNNGDDDISDRIVLLYNCIDQEYCIEDELALGTGQLKEHMTHVAGIIAADLTDNQDTQYTTPTQKLNRTGMAPESELCLISAEEEDEFIMALEQAINLTYGVQDGYSVDIINLSMSSNGGRYCNGDPIPYCATIEQQWGIDSISLSVDNVFNSGVFVSVAAGNFNDSYCPCPPTVTAPSTARGAFSVGAYDASNDDPNNSNNFRLTGNVMSYSGAGPAGGRIKPDIVAPTNVMLMPKYDNDYKADGFGGTSAATPVVSGAAAILLDWGVWQFGTGVAGEPGRLFVNLLNFGDRRNESPCIPDAQCGMDSFSNVYGSGRLRMRLPIEAGMDNPYRWYTTHVDFNQNNQTYTIKLNEGALGANPPIPSDVKLLKIALWWIEPASNLQSMKSQITSNVKRKIGLFNWVTVKAKDSNDDQKIHYIFDSNESYFPDFISDYSYKLEVTSTYIPSGRTLRVWISYFWEDLDRNDVEGPRNDVDEDDNRYLLYR